MKTLFVYIGIFMLMSCGKSTLGPEKYILWCNKNLSVRQEMDKFTFDTRAVTEDYRAAREGTTSDAEKKKDFQSIYVTVKIGNPGGEEVLLGQYNTSDFNNTLTYFIERAKKDFVFVVNEDTLKPSLYHFERLYNVANFSVIDMVFETRANTKLQDCRLVYNDQKLGVGKVTIAFPKLNSENMPELIQ